MINKTKEQIRMELYKEVYLNCFQKTQGCAGNLAQLEAERAVRAFNEFFKDEL